MVAICEGDMILHLLLVHDGHIHEDKLLARILKRPTQSASADDGLEIGPVVGAGRRIFVMQPYSDSVVNESLVERKIFLEEREDVYLFVDGDVQI